MNTSSSTKPSDDDSPDHHWEDQLGRIIVREEGDAPPPPSQEVCVQRRDDDGDHAEGISVITDLETIQYDLYSGSNAQGGRIYPKLLLEEEEDDDEERGGPSVTLEDMEQQYHSRRAMAPSLCSSSSLSKSRNSHDPTIATPSAVDSLASLRTAESHQKSSNDASSSSPAAAQCSQTPGPLQDTTSHQQQGKSNPMASIPNNSDVQEPGAVCEDGKERFSQQASSASASASPSPGTAPAWSSNATGSLKKEGITTEESLGAFSSTAAISNKQPMPTQPVTYALQDDKRAPLLNCSKEVVILECNALHSAFASMSEPSHGGGGGPDDHHQGEKSLDPLDSIQDLPPLRRVSHTSSSEPGAYYADGDGSSHHSSSSSSMRRHSQRSNNESGVVVTEDSETSSCTATTPTPVPATPAATLIRAELAPVDYEQIVAERDALKKTFESIPEASEVVPETIHPMDNKISKDTAKNSEAKKESRKVTAFWLVLAVVCCIVMLMGILIITLVVLNLSGGDEADDITSSSPSEENSYWSARRIGPTILGGEAYSEFGEFLSLSHDGTLLAVGGEEAGENAGQVVVYQQQQPSNDNQKEITWQPQFEMWGDTPGEESAKVALSSDGTRLAIGGMKASGVGTGQEKFGRVRTFQLSSSSSSGEVTASSQQQQPIGQVLEGRHTQERFGSDVQFSADGSIMAVGSMGTRLPHRNGTEFGSVQVFQYNQSTNIWDGLGQELNGDHEADFFGWSTALSADGRILAAGGYGYDANENRDRSGIVRVYQLDLVSLLWKQLGQDFYGEEAGDELGRSISLSSDGQIIAFGGYRHNNSTGRVYVYQWDNTLEAWEPKGQAIDGFQQGDRLGRSVALSGDGSMLATGAYWSNDRAGHVRVFSWNKQQETWDQMGPAIPGSATSWFGRRIAMSRDGTTLAIGGPFDSTNGRSAGKVEVYSLST